eukprot:5513413-Pleurochrysis_carterae.AAC.3
MSPSGDAIPGLGCGRRGVGGWLSVRSERSTTPTPTSVASAMLIRLSQSCRPLRADGWCTCAALAAVDAAAALPSVPC